MHAEEIFVKGAFRELGYPDIISCETAKPVRFFRPSEAMVNPSLKRFEVQTKYRFTFSSIDASDMLNQLGESFPRLEEFIIHSDWHWHAVRFDIVCTLACPFRGNGTLLMVTLITTWSAWLNGLKTR